MLNEIIAFEKKIEAIHDPVKKINALTEFCYMYMDSMEFTDLCYQKIQEIESLLKTIDYPKGKADNYSNLSYYYWAKNEIDNAIHYAHVAIPLYKSINDTAGEANALQLISISHIAKGAYDEALKAAFESIKLVEVLPQTMQSCWSYFACGIAYYEMKDYTAAGDYYLKMLSIATEIKSHYSTARAKVALGNLYTIQKKYEEAYKSIKEAAELFRAIGHKIGLSRALNDLGILCMNSNKMDEAEQYLNESFKIRNNLNHIQGVITTSYEIGKLLLVKEDYNGAIESLHKALILAQENNAKNKEYNIHKSLSDAYVKINDMQKAYQHLISHLELHSIIMGQETNQKLKRIETKLATEKAEKEAEIERIRNVELKNANDAIALKNKEILDSINYAKRLQEAILPSSSTIKKYFPENFIFYQPKDIVAGDFYWIEKTNDSILLATADCTGHGVPGAMVSMVCYNALNSAIKEFNLVSPEKILNKVRELVIQTFDNNETAVKDGMDCVLCSFNFNEMKLNYSAANNHFYLVRNGELLIQNTDKMPVGKPHSEYLQEFKLYSFDLEKGDCIYTFTDGYADQFGGVKGKKFKYKQLQELLVSVSHLSIQEQYEKIRNTINSWKGSSEQVDDILIIGIKV